MRHSWKVLSTQHKILWALYAVAVVLAIMDLSLHTAFDPTVLPHTMEYIEPWWRMMQGLVLLGLPLLIGRLLWQSWQNKDRF